MKPLIITAARSQEHPLNWKKQLKSSAKLAPDLASSAFATTYQAYLNKNGGSDPFPLRIPHAFVARMLHQPEWENVLRQFIPDPHECEKSPEYIADPVGDLQSMKTQGLLHKYQHRVLIVSTGICPVHCRYCFRRNFNYDDQSARTDQFSGALQYVSTQKDISEVILSGGDPLSLEDDVLIELLLRIQRIRHIKTIRLHTRYPAIVPARVSEPLLKHFYQTKDSLRLVMVLHSNHPHEIDAETESAIQALRDSGITLLNQSVLLKGVNDNAQTLINLSNQLHRNGVLPYYLHLLDPVAGSQRFHVDMRAAKKIYQQMQQSLAGYLVPRLVREVAGQPSKQLIPVK